MVVDVSKIIKGTGNYESVKSGNTVSITGDGGNAWNYFGPAYKPLAPRLFTYEAYAKGLEEENKLKENLNMYKEYLEYRKKLEYEYIFSYYNTRLKDLDVYKLLSILYDKFGENIIFLCHEPIDEFCHRRVFADFIELKTGVYIPEISVSESGIVKTHTPIRYTKELKQIMRIMGD